MTITDKSDIVLLVMEILPAQELKRCLMVNKLWRGLAEIVVRKRLMVSCTVNNQMPPLCGNERIPADILVHYEDFVAKFSHLERIWPSKDSLVVTNSVTKGRIDSKDRNINHVSTVEAVLDYVAMPTLMRNGQIVLCLRKNRPQFRISMFLVDPFENTMKWLPWKLTPDIIPSTSTNARWYVYCNSGGQLVVCDPVSLECARYRIKDRVKCTQIYGDFLVAKSRLMNSPTREVLEVNELPSETVHDGIKAVLSIVCGGVKAFKLHDKFLVFKERRKRCISIYNLEEKNLYHTFSVSGLLIKFKLTRFHCIVYQLPLTPRVVPDACQIRMAILNLSTLSLHEVDFNSDMHGYRWISLGYLYDESGFVIYSPHSQDLTVATLKGIPRVATGIPEPGIGCVFPALHSIGNYHSLFQYFLGQG